MQSQKQRYMGYAMESLSVSLAYCAIADPLSCFSMESRSYTISHGLNTLQQWHYPLHIAYLYIPLSFLCGFRCTVVQITKLNIKKRCTLKIISELKHSSLFRPFYVPRRLTSISTIPMQILSDSIFYFKIKKHVSKNFENWRGHLKDMFTNTRPVLTPTEAFILWLRAM